MDGLVEETNDLGIDQVSPQSLGQYCKSLAA